MSRSGYSDDGDYDTINLYRANVDRAFSGKRGQKFLRELLAALDALPEKKLIDYNLQRDGSFCALGAVVHARGMEMPAEPSDPEDDGGYIARTLAHKLGIAEMMAQEIVYMNDEVIWREETPEQRFVRMRKWIEGEIKP